MLDAKTTVESMFFEENLVREWYINKRSRQSDSRIGVDPYIKY